MKSKSSKFSLIFLVVVVCATACNKETSPNDGAPPTPQVVPTGDMSLVSVDKPDQFLLVAAAELNAASELKVTGSVLPDVSREIPVISLANGRVVDIKARLDDFVKKGDLLIKVQSPDIAGAFDIYQKAANDERMDNLAYERAKTLFEHGAIAQSALKQAEDTEKNAQADLTASEETLKTLGVDKGHLRRLVHVQPILQQSKRPADSGSQREHSTASLRS